MGSLHLAKLVTTPPARCSDISDTFKMSHIQEIMHGCTQALASSQTFIFEERERLLALQAENADLRLQEAEDRARINCLVAMLDSSKGPGVPPKEAVKAAASSESVNDLKLRVASLQDQLAEQVQSLHCPLRVQSHLLHSAGACLP